MDIFLSYLKVIYPEAGKADSSLILDLIGGFYKPWFWPGRFQRLREGLNLARSPIAVPVVSEVGSDF